MKLSELFDCKKPIPFLEWYLQNRRNIEGVKNRRLYTFPSHDKVAQFLSQSFTKDMVIRPEKPKKDGLGGYGKILSQWNNWQPIFLGEWSVEYDEDGESIWFKAPEEMKLSTNGGWTLVKNGENEEDTIDDIIRELQFWKLRLNPNYTI